MVAEFSRSRFSGVSPSQRDRSFPSRAMLVKWAAGHTPKDGAIYGDGTVLYKGSTGATAIADLPGLVPFGTPTLAHWPDTTAGHAAALTYAAAKGIGVLSAPSGSLPSSYTATLDYQYDAGIQLFTLASAEARTAKRMIRAQHAASHADASVYTVGIETRPAGSGKNGPTSADYGMGISVIKQGFGAASRPTSGEIDGMYIVIRQDGPQGLASGDAGSSDAAGILIDAQNVGDAGFIAAIEASTSNIDAATRSVVDYRIRTQIGVLTMNGGPVSYGFVAMSQDGTNTHAFYAGESGGTWTNLFKAPNVLTIDGDGGYHIQTADWTTYAARFRRGTGLNDALNITQRGTGAIQITTQDAAVIGFATSNTQRWQINATGAFLPETDLAVNIGAASKQVSSIYASQVILSGNNQQMNALPVYADNAAASAGGLAAGRVYRTATGELRIVV